MHFRDWVKRAAKYGSASRRLDLPPGWSSLEPDELAAVVCPQLCALHFLASEGDADAQFFFRRFSQTLKPPTPPRFKVGGVGLVLGSCDFPGGLETWVQAMIRNPNRQFSGVAVENNNISGIKTVTQRITQVGTRLMVGPGSSELLANHSDTLIISGARTIQAGWGFHGPIISVSHGADQWTKDSLEAVAAFATHNVAVSELAVKPFPTGDATVIHNGVDPARVRTSMTKKAARRKLGIPQDAKHVVGYMGRFAPDKDPIAAAKACRKLGPDFVPVMIGGGWNAKEVKAQAKAACPWVRLVKSQADVSVPLRAMDVMVSTAPHEGFNQSLVEAWMAGVPAVTRATGIAYTARKRWGDVCFVWDGKRAATLAELIKRAKSSEGVEVARRAKRAALKHLDVETFHKAWDAYLKQAELDLVG